MNNLMHCGRIFARMSLGLVAFGGLGSVFSVKADPPVITNPTDIRFLDHNQAFNPFATSPSWVEKAPMPTSRIAFATAAVNGKIYAISGRDTDIDVCEALETVEAYDTATDTWERNLAEPPTKRYRAAAAALGGVIYLVGGEDRSMPEVCGDVVSTVEVYDPVSNTWSSKAPIKVARSLISLAVDEANNKLYAIGGSNGRNGGYVAD